MENKIDNDYYEFEKIVKKINTDKFHVSRTVEFTTGKPTISSWQIFRKDMPIDMYFNPQNISLLSSYKGNTYDDIKKLIKQENNIFYKLINFIKRRKTNENNFK